MSATTLPMDRPQTRGEEVANSISHGVGFVLSVAALPVLVSACVARGGHAINVAEVCVCAATMVLLYGYFRSTTIGTNCSASRTRCATPALRRGWRTGRLAGERPSGR